MYNAVLRIGGDTFDPDTDLQLLSIPPTKIFRRGEKLGRKVVEKNGCNIAAGEGKDVRATLNAVEGFLARECPFLEAMKKKRLSMEIDFSLLVEAEVPVRSFWIPAEQLSKLVSYGITVRVSAYLG
jgi:hypothetical protein